MTAKEVKDKKQSGETMIKGKAKSHKAEAHSDGAQAGGETAAAGASAEAKADAGSEGAAAAAGDAKVSRKKLRRAVPQGRAYIHASYNNTKVTLTDEHGQVIAWSSSGLCGFKGPKKSTPYAASVAATRAVELSKLYGLQQVDVFVKGVGGGREQAIRALQANGLQVNAIADVTPVPHGGCRPPKARRV